jgi:hypothetical protein
LCVRVQVRERKRVRERDDGERGRMACEVGRDALWDFCDAGVPPGRRDCSRWGWDDANAVHRVSKVTGNGGCVFFFSFFLVVSYTRIHFRLTFLRTFFTFLIAVHTVTNSNHPQASSPSHADIAPILHALGADAECACAGTSSASPSSSAPVPAAPALPTVSLQVLPAKEKGKGSGTGSEKDQDGRTEDEGRGEDAGRACVIRAMERMVFPPVAVPHSLACTESGVRG